MTLTVTRRQVLSYRVMALGLGRDTAVPDDLEVLDLGLQDTNVDSARLALAARLPPGYDDPVTAESFALVWSFRGAPHLHRRGDLPELAARLWPVSDADAVARLAAERGPLKAAGIGGREAFATAAAAMRVVVTAPLTKGEVSAGVTERVPEPYRRWCPSCQATHIYTGLFQSVGLFAGVRLLPDRSPAVLAPLEERAPVPPASAGATELLRAYATLFGPATPASAASYLGSTATALRSAWPDDLVEVGVDGQRAWIPPERADALREAPESTGIVRLLPPSDPYLQARDRDLLVPEKSRQKAVWRAIGNPGAVLADGEIAGTWRARTRGKRIEITVQPFEELSASTRAAIESEAERVATIRGAPDVSVRYDDA